MNQQDMFSKENEIDLMSLFLKVWSKRNIIFICTGIFFFIGILVANLTPREYTAYSTFIYRGSASNEMEGFSSIAGINLNTNRSKELFSTELYPDIINSIPFQKELIQTRLNFSFQKEPLTFSEYYLHHAPTNYLSTLKKYTILLPFTLWNAVSSIGSRKVSSSRSTAYTKDSLPDGLYLLSGAEMSLFGRLSSQMNLDINSRKGTISLSFSMPEALAAAQMTEKAQQVLQQTLIDYKIKQRKKQLNFIEEQYRNSKNNFERKQLELASFQDKNRGLMTALSQTRLQRLKSEYELAFAIFSDFAKQLETKRIQMQEDTPVFVNIEPIRIPQGPSSPQKTRIIVKWSSLGFILGLVVIVGLEFIKNYKHHKKSN